MVQPVLVLTFGFLISALPLRGAIHTGVHYSRQHAGLSDDDALGFSTSFVQRDAAMVIPGSAAAPLSSLRNESAKREIIVVDRSANAVQVASDATSDVVLGTTILAVTLIMVVALCLYLERDDDSNLSKRNQRKPLRGSGARSGGERPVPPRPVPTSFPTRMSGAPAGGYVGSPPMAQGAGPAQPLRGDGSDHSHRQSPIMQPQSPPQHQSPLQPQMQPQVARNPVQMVPAPVPPQGWERSSMASSMGGSFSRSMSGILGTTAGSSAKRPPALCAALVLPHCEAWFAVSWDKIATSAQSFEFFGLSGKALLRAQVNFGSNSMRKISISMTPARSPTLGSCSGGTGSSMEVRGAADKPYGELRRRQIPGQFSLVHSSNGEEVVNMTFEPPPSNHLILRAVDGSPIAAASRCVESDFFSGIEHLEVRVNPGVDAVLVLCCVLGVVLVDGGEMPSGFSLGNASPQV